MKTAIMTDSNSGIYPAEANEMGIWSIQMPVIINGETRFEGKDLFPEEFFELQKSGAHITTSQPTPGDVTAMWDEILASGFDEVVYIPMSSALSYSCETAKVLAADYQGKVRVTDNRRISFSQRTAVMEAVEMARRGLPAMYIASDLELHAWDASIYLAVDTLEYLKRGGRITPAAAALGSILKIKPVMAIQGEKLDLFSKERGTNKAMKRMLGSIKHDAKKRLGGKKENLIFGMAGAGLESDFKQEMLELAKKEFEAEVIYDDLPISVCVHTGPGAWGLGVHLKHALAQEEDPAAK